MAVLGAVLLAGVFGFADRALDRRADLQRSGLREQGVVTGVRGGRNDSVEVEFDWRGPRQERIYVGEASSYTIGDQVTVVIDRDDPELFSLEAEDNYPPWSVALTTVMTTGAVILLSGGVGTVLRAARQRRVLARFGWRRSAITSHEIPGRQGVVRPVLLVETDEHPRGIVLALVAMNQRRLGKLGLRGATAADVAGPLPGYVVLRVPGHNGLVSARPPWRERDERSWRETLEQVRQTGPASLQRNRPH
jgi:hypothetical protein